MTVQTQNFTRIVGIVVFVTTIGVLGLIRNVGLTAWWTTPAILTIAGLLPFIVRRQCPPAILRPETLGRDLRLTLFTSLAILPMTYLVMGLIHRAGMSLPCIPVKPSSYVAWVIYQFLYVAVAEEFFFRGYLQGMLTQKQEARSKREEINLQYFLISIRHSAPIVVSAALFALAHVVVQDEPAAILLFLPGVVFGWLYMKTGTLLSPILFHGLANVFWQLTTGP